MSPRQFVTRTKCHHDNLSFSLLTSRAAVLSCLIRGKKKSPLLKDPGNSPFGDVALLRFIFCSPRPATSPKGLLRGFGGEAPNHFAARLVRAFRPLRFLQVLAALAFAYLPQGALSQDVPISAVNQVNVDLTYSVESATIGAGTAWGTAAAWALNEEQLAEFGLDPGSAVGWFVADEFATVVTNTPLDESVQWFLENASTNSGLLTDEQWVDFNERQALILEYASSNNAGIAVFGGSHSLGGDLDVNTMKMAENLGVNELDELDSEDIAPIVSTSSDSQVTGFSANAWQRLFSSVSGDLDFIDVYEILPAVSDLPHSSKFALAVQRIYGNVLEHLDEFFGIVQSKLGYIRLAVMVGMVVMVGRKFFIFCVRVGPALINCVANVLSNGVLKDDSAINSDLMEL